MAKFSLTNEGEGKVRSISSMPPKPVPPKVNFAKENLAEIGLNVAGSMAQVGFANAQKSVHDSATKMQKMTETISQYADSGEDFIRRFDTEIRPQFQNELINSSAHQKVADLVPAMAFAVDERAKHQEYMATQALTLADINRLRNNYASYSDWEREAEKIFNGMREKYGKLSPSTVDNFENVKRAARDSYARGEIKDTLSRLTTSMVNGYTTSGMGTPQNAKEWLEEDLIPLIRNEDNDYWKKALLKPAITEIVQNAPSVEWAESFVDSMSEYLSRVESVALKAVGQRSEEIELNNRKKSLQMFQKEIDNKLNHGAWVEPELVTTREQAEKNAIALNNDLRRMPPKEILEIPGISPEYADTLIRNFAEDFSTDFVSAAKKYLNLEVKPLMAPILNEGGQPMYLPEALQSLRERTYQSKYVSTIYEDAPEVSENMYSPGELNPWRQFSAKLSSGDRLSLGAQLLEILKGPRGNKAYADIAELTGDKGLATILAMSDKRLPMKDLGGMYEKFQYLYKEKPDQFAQKSAWTEQWLDKVTFHGKPIHVASLPKELKDMIQMYGVGNNIDSKKELDKHLSKAINVSTFNQQKGYEWQFKNTWAGKMYGAGVNSERFAFDVLFKAVPEWVTIAPEKSILDTPRGDLGVNVYFNNFFSNILWGAPPQSDMQGVVTFSKTDRISMEKYSTVNKFTFKGKEQTALELLYMVPNSYISNYGGVNSAKNFAIYYHDKNNIKHLLTDDEGKVIQYSIP